MKHAARNNISLLTVKYFRSLQTLTVFSGVCVVRRVASNISRETSAIRRARARDNSGAAFPCSLSGTHRGHGLCNMLARALARGALSCEDH